MQIRIETPAGIHSFDAGSTIAVPLGEAVTLGNAQTTIAPTDGIPAEAFTIDQDRDNRITFHAPGRYPLTVASGFEQAALDVVAYEPAILDAVKVKEGGDERRRRVVSELARWEPTFTGTIGSFRTFNPERYGATK